MSDAGPVSHRRVWCPGVGPTKHKSSGFGYSSYTMGRAIQPLGMCVREDQNCIVRSQCDRGQKRINLSIGGKGVCSINQREEFFRDRVFLCTYLEVQWIPCPA